MTDTIATAITDEQKAEWNALHDAMAKLSEARTDAEREAGSWLAWGIQHPDSVEFAQERAMAEAQRAIDTWAERQALQAKVDAHPYTPEVRARIQALREAREAREATS